MHVGFTYPLITLALVFPVSGGATAWRVESFVKASLGGPRSSGGGIAVTAKRRYARRTKVSVLKNLNLEDNEIDVLQIVDFILRYLDTVLKKWRSYVVVSGEDMEEEVGGQDSQLGVWISRLYRSRSSLASPARLHR